MEIFAALIIGILIGIAAMAISASNSYEKGRKDEREKLPNDISNYLNDQR